MNDNNSINYNKLFGSWFETATLADRQLYITVLQYEEDYFPDMTFKPDSIISDFIRLEMPCDNGVYVTDYEDGPEELFSISDGYYRCFINNLDDSIGRVNKKERTLTISPEYANDKSTILHEMIHAYISLVDYYAQFYHDILLLCLYNNLKGKISDLDNRILGHAHVWKCTEITKRGGSHDILFFLKSLDLDLRCGYKLGTVCGYGRDIDETMG